VLVGEDPSRACVAGPLEPYAAGFAAELSRLGYASGSAYGQMLLMAHLSRWLFGEGLDAGRLTPQAVGRFLAHRRAVGYAQLLSPKGLAPLLGYLRRLGVAPEAPVPVPAGPAGELLERYRCYLVTERGLGTATAADYAAKARSFLAGREKAGTLDLAGLTAADVTAFIRENCPSMRRGAAKLTVTALRSLLGYLHVAGDIPGPLAWAVPAVATWRLASLPVPLEPGQVAAMLAGCDTGTAAGGVTWRYSPCWPGSGCGPARSRPCPWTTSTGEPGKSPSRARADAASGCRCRPTPARLSPPTCGTAGLSRPGTPGGCSCVCTRRTRA
jgi:integrase/recombinase XerD